MSEAFQLGDMDMLEVWEIARLPEIQQAIHPGSGKNVIILGKDADLRRRCETKKGRCALRAIYKGVAVYIRGNQIVIADAPVTEDGVYKTQVRI